MQIFTDRWRVFKQCLRALPTRWTRGLTNGIDDFMSLNQCSSMLRFRIGFRVTRPNVGGVIRLCGTMWGHVTNAER